MNNICKIESPVVVYATIMTNILFYKVVWFSLFLFLACFSFFLLFLQEVQVVLSACLEILQLQQEQVRPVVFHFFATFFPLDLHRLADLGWPSSTCSACSFVCCCACCSICIWFCRDKIISINWLLRFGDCGIDCWAGGDVAGGDVAAGAVAGEEGSVRLVIMWREEVGTSADGAPCDGSTRCCARARTCVAPVACRLAVGTHMSVSMVCMVDTDFVFLNWMALISLFMRFAAKILGWWSAIAWHKVGKQQ